MVQKSREDYSAQKARLIEAVLTVPAGSLCLRPRWRRKYWYLRTYDGGNARREVFLGPEDDPRVRALGERIEQRRAALAELREVKKALKKLGAKPGELAEHDPRPALRQSFAAWQQERRAWDGAGRVGDWCFLALQNHGGVEPLPLAVVELDPDGTLADLEEPPGPKPEETPGRREAGEAKGRDIFADESVFADEALFADGAVFYGQGPARAEDRGPLPGQPGAEECLDLLLDHAGPVKIHGMGRVTLPGLAAFFLHKLLMAGGGRDAAGAARDLEQAAAVARALAASPDMARELRGVWNELPPGWRVKIIGQKQALESLAGDGAKATLGLLGGL